MTWTSLCCLSLWLCKELTNFKNFRISPVVWSPRDLEYSLAQAFGIENWWISKRCCLIGAKHVDSPEILPILTKHLFTSSLLSNNRLALRFNFYRMSHSLFLHLKSHKNGKVGNNEQEGLCLLRLMCISSALCFSNSHLLNLHSYSSKTKPLCKVEANSQQKDVDRLIGQ